MKKNDKIQCLVCKKFFKTIASGHLLSVHNLTTEQYRTKYKGAPTQSESYSRNNCAARAKSVASRSPERQAEVQKNCSDAKRKQFDAYTPEQLEAWGQRISKQMRAYVDRMTPKQRAAYGKRMTENMLSVPHVKYRDVATPAEWKAFIANASAKAKARFEDPSERKRISDAAKARFARMSPEELREFVRKLQPKDAGTSKPEKKLVKAIKKLGFEVLKGHKIDRYVVDAFLPEENLVVEVYGDYWHVNPDRYEPDFVHPQLKKTAAEIWKRDKARVKAIKKLGYRVVIVWEHEVKELTSDGLQRKLQGNTEPSRSRK